MLRRSPRALKARQLAPPLLFVGLIASLVAAVLGRPIGAAIPGVYGGFLILGAIAEMIRRRDLAAVALPAVLAVMHLGWGHGFLFGRARL